jgi:hypothetical protein
MSYNATLADVNNKTYVSGVITVGTTAVEAKVGGSRISPREMVRIYNNDPSITIYFGAAGVTVATGEPLRPGEAVSVPAGDELGVFVIAASGSVNVRVQEMA